MSFKFKMTIPKPNLKWYNTSKKELLKAVEEYNKENWATETDPTTGKRWQPRKRPTGGWPLLKKSGKMQKSTKFLAGNTPMDFKAKVGVKYGGFHQRGTSKMVQRRWLGIGSRATEKLMPIIKKNIFKGKYTFQTS